MSRWRLVDEVAGEDERPGYQLIELDNEAHASPQAWVYTKKIADRIKTALDWLDAFEQGYVSLPPKPQTKAGTARPRPARKTRSNRAKGLK